MQEHNIAEDTKPPLCPHFSCRSSQSSWHTPVHTHRCVSKTHSLAGISASLTRHRQKAQPGMHKMWPKCPWLVQVQEKVKAGLVPMNKYIITKQLTKRPEDYPDAKNQAHVQVALRRRAAGKRDGVMQVHLHSCLHQLTLP